MSRFERKNRTDIIIKSQGQFFDLVDNAIKEVYRINDAEYDYMAGAMSDQELDLFISILDADGGPGFSEKRKVLMLLDHYLKQYNEKV